MEDDVDGPVRHVPRDGGSAESAAYTEERVLLGIAELAVQATRARAASITILDGQVVATPVATAPLARRLDDVQYVDGDGPCVTSVRTGVVVTIDDMAAEQRWGRFTAAARAAGVVASLSLPISVEKPYAAGLNVYADRAEHLAGAGRTRLLGIVDLAAVSFTLLRRHHASMLEVAQLSTAMQSRAVIDQARGILMAEHHCDAAAAFALLRATSQASNRKMRDLAADLVRRAAEPQQGRG